MASDDGGRRAEPTVSAVTSTFNRASMLREAVESALGQTRPPDEIVVVDDGSTDETPEVMSSYAARHARVRYVRLPRNVGMDAAARVAVERSSGRYVAFLDSDDVWLPEHLESCVGALEGRPGAALAFGRYGVIDASGRVLVAEVGEPALAEMALPQILLKRITVTPSRSVFRRDALAEAGGVPQLGLVFDWALNVLVASRSPGSVIQVPRRTVLMREHESNSYSRPEVLRDCLARGTEYIFARLPPDWRHYRRRVEAVCLVTSALFFWRAGRSAEAWAHLLRAVRRDPGCVVERDFRDALTRLAVPPGVGRAVRDWRRGLRAGR